MSFFTLSISISNTCSSYGFQLKLKSQIPSSANSVQELKNKTSLMNPIYHEMFGVPRNSFPCGGSSSFTADVYFSPNYQEQLSTDYPEDNDSGVSWDPNSIQHFLNSDNTPTQTGIVGPSQIDTDWSKVLYSADAVDSRPKVVFLFSKPSLMIDPSWNTHVDMFLFEFRKHWCNNLMFIISNVSRFLLENMFVVLRIRHQVSSRLNLGCGGPRSSTRPLWKLSISSEAVKVRKAQAS